MTNDLKPISWVYRFFFYHSRDQSNNDVVIYAVERILHVSSCSLFFNAGHMRADVYLGCSVVGSKPCVDCTQLHRYKVQILYVGIQGHWICANIPSLLSLCWPRRSVGCTLAGYTSSNVWQLDAGTSYLASVVPHPILKKHLIN